MANYTNLSKGSKGEEVKTLQKTLNENGYHLDVDGSFGAKTQAAVKDYQQKNGLTVDGVVGSSTWSALTNPQTSTANQSGWSYDSFKVSSDTAAADQKRQQVEAQKPGAFSYADYEKGDGVKQAEALLQQQLDNQPEAYQSQWQAALDDTMQKILNREKFSYDVNADALYQQYKDQYVTQGQQAMMDTMGQAQAMTGGYGNSYAQTVGQQTYQGYLQKLNDQIPQLYQLALDTYQRGGEELMNQYGMYLDREEQDYGRYRDTVSDYREELARLTEDARYQSESDYERYLDAYQKAYGEHRDAVADWRQDQQQADTNYWNLYNRDYGQWENDRAFAYGQYLDDRNYQYQQERDRIADEQWQKEFAEAQRQYQQSYALSAAKNQKSEPETEKKTGNATFDNGNVSKGNIKIMQRILGLVDDGYWGSAAYKASGGMTADQAWEAYQRGSLQMRYSPKSGLYDSTSGEGDYTQNVEDFIASMGSQESFGGSAETYQDYIYNELSKADYLTDDELNTLIDYYNLK